MHETIVDSYYFDKRCIFLANSRPIYSSYTSCHLMRDGYARKDFQLRLVFQSHGRSVDRTISAVLQIFVAVDRGAFSIRGSRNERDRMGLGGDGYVSVF